MNNDTGSIAPLSERDRTLARLMLYALVGRKVPCPQGTEGEELFRAAKRQEIASLLFVSFEENAEDLIWLRFRDAFYAMQRRDLLLAHERENVYAAFVKAGIGYLPLKGAVLSAWYPLPGMRHMSDCDILLDESQADAAQAVMFSLGYSEKGKHGADHHDVYLKPPCYVYELHRTLFETFYDEHDAFADAYARAVEVGEGRREMTMQDLCAYQVAHFKKHLYHAGCGVRHLADLFIIRRHFGDAFDLSALEAHLQDIGLGGILPQALSVCDALLSDTPLSDEGAQMLSVLCEGGVYGTYQRLLTQSREADGLTGRGGYMRYLRRRVFPPFAVMKEKYPVLRRHPILLPICYLRRITHVWRRRREIRKECRTVKELRERERQQKDV